MASKLQKSWTESSLRGFAELARGRPEAAARCWLEADAEFPSTIAFDPRKAASRSNAGTARLLLGHDHEAELCFEDAHKSWEALLGWIEALDVPLSAASSSFHFRLAAKAPDALAGVLKERYRRRAEAAIAITEFNRSLRTSENSAPDVLSARAAALKRELADQLGVTSPEARLLTSYVDRDAPSDVYAIYGDKVSDAKSDQQTRAAALSADCAALESALTLTALLARPIFESARRLAESETDETDNSDQARAASSSYDA